MTSKLFSLALAGALAAGTMAVPAAATPGGPGASKPGSVQQPAPMADVGRAIPVRHLNRRGRYCRRQYRLGFVLGRRGARLFFRRHCHWRGRHWNRGYRGHWRHRGNHRWRRHHRRFGR